MSFFYEFFWSPEKYFLSFILFSFSSYFVLELIFLGICIPDFYCGLWIRYGSTDELKVLVKRFHEVGIKVLGDVVLNHRCAQYKNQNGVWNIFGGLLNWDDRAVVADDPHFQVKFLLIWHYGF